MNGITLLQYLIFLRRICFIRVWNCRVSSSDTVQRTHVTKDVRFVTKNINYSYNCQGIPLFNNSTMICLHVDSIKGRKVTVATICRMTSLISFWICESGFSLALLSSSDVLSQTTSNCHLSITSWVSSEEITITNFWIVFATSHSNRICQFSSLIGIRHKINCIGLIFTVYLHDKRYLIRVALSSAWNWCSIMAVLTILSIYVRVPCNYSLLTYWTTEVSNRDTVHDNESSCCSYLLSKNWFFLGNLLIARRLIPKVLIHIFVPS